MRRLFVPAFAMAMMAAGAACAHVQDTALLGGAGGASFFSLGVLLGLAHALDGDHLAAVAAMINRREPRRAMAARGALWGLGHTLALMVICTSVVLLGLTISGQLEAALEFTVGVMIVGLGLRVLWKLRSERIHLHVHNHGQAQHVHLHSHAGDPQNHAEARHAHKHRRGGMATLGIGLVHGAAGSASLVVLAVATADSTGEAIGYFAAFGLGTMLGMTALTTLASWPLERLQRSAAWMQGVTTVAIGTLAVTIGSALAYESFGGMALF
ncbi:sulfite exporter TauE/SafE family protein [Puniceibacterium sp. IMCC21224]|uniref:urease accessory protein UreH domain-containing protein n=1 Tax=Puniceibacterium sp. IMCC21224 TaxID=1618204 RepID=UPI00065D6F06|nr:sulfite exporter TauE/SafE family protein [Puniceibacterium sp. IMCC21224]KMK65013.1 High-affinity nickel-transport protein [Puniceibacterium sp. IMCC21224]